MRLFVAVDVPDAIKDAVERDVVTPLRDTVPGARWSRPEGRHLTLKFLGEVAEDRVASAAEALQKAASAQAGFGVAFDVFGGFPNVRRPRVLWLRIGDGSDDLAALAQAVEGALQPLGFPGEDRSFRGHFTLARFPKPRILESLPSVDVPTARWRVDEVTLFRSQLHPKGARYTALERFPLRA